MLKSYKSLVFNTFSFEPSKKEIFLVYQEAPEFSEITNRPSPSSLPCLLLCFARRPPYADGGPPPRRVRGQVDPGELSSATWPASWHLPMLTRVRGALPSRHARPAMQLATCSLRQLAVESPQTKSTFPRRRSPRPGLLSPINSPRTPAVAQFLLFLPSSTVRHGRRDLAHADRPPQPRIAPSNHPSSFATPQLSSTRVESNPIPLPTPFPFCAAAGELGLTADRPAQRESEHDSYPRRILKLTWCSCVPYSPTPSPPSPTTPADQTSPPPLAPASSIPTFLHPNGYKGRCSSISTLPRASPLQPR